MQKLQSLKDVKFEPLSATQMRNTIGGDSNRLTNGGTLKDGRKYDCDHENYDSTGMYKNTTYTMTSTTIAK